VPISRLVHATLKSPYPFLEVESFPPIQFVHPLLGIQIPASNVVNATYKRPVNFARVLMDSGYTVNSDIDVNINISFIGWNYFIVVLSIQARKLDNRLANYPQGVLNLLFCDDQRRRKPDNVLVGRLCQ
jgi:hypothetical protein